MQWPPPPPDPVKMVEKTKAAINLQTQLEDRIAHLRSDAPRVDYIAELESLRREIDRFYNNIEVLRRMQDHRIETGGFKTDDLEEVGMECQAKLMMLVDGLDELEKMEKEAWGAAGLKYEWFAERVMQKPERPAGR